MVKSEEGNGFIPVKYEYCEVMYDTMKNEYLAIVKIGTKKYSFQLIK